LGEVEGWRDVGLGALLSAGVKKPKRPWASSLMPAEKNNQFFLNISA